VLRAPVSRLPVELDVSVPVRNFRVRNLLTLELAQVIESGWGHARMYPGLRPSAAGLERVRSDRYAAGGARHPAGLSAWEI